VGLVRTPLAFACAAAEHLLKEDPRLHRPQEHDELEVGNIDTGREEIHRYRDGWVRPVAELTDALEGPIHAACDLLHERLAATESIATELYELVGGRRVRQIVECEADRVR